MHAQPGIDDRHAVGAHLCGADRMEDRGGDVAGRARQLLGRVIPGPGLEFLRADSRRMRCVAIRRRAAPIDSTATWRSFSVD